MKKITCKKPCNIGGTRFAVGDTIPEELIDPVRETTIAKYGFISVEEVRENAPSNPATNTPDGNKGGTQEPMKGQQSESSTGNGDGEKGSTDESTPDDASTGDDGKKKAGKKVSK